MNCSCSYCLIDKQLSQVSWDSVIRSLEHPSDILRVGTVSYRLKDFVLGKILLAVPEIKKDCKKECK